MRDVFIVALVLIPVVAIVGAVWGDIREDRRTRREIEEHDRAWDRYIEERRLALEEEIMRKVAGAPSPRPRITWVDELRDPVRPASQRGAR